MTPSPPQAPFVVVTTSQSFDHACAALEAAIPSHGFGLLGSHDLGGTLRHKGIAFAEQCRIFEVCQPQQAARVLSADMALNMALPCRISVYTEAGQTRIGMISPMAMLSALSSDPALAAVAAEVEATTRAIITTAAETTP
ncbi:MAG: DUF302 domain-containing protein [Cyanobacteria bacterium M_surface_7_m2_040]|nr:DUF302 domain-containing protein [Cyanobacteria bacterium K_Offshore_0m_m2_072]MBM5810268.1 DUF302 domain-containing protein [Cyanobacteria bacterium M_surface_9_m1_291]MBM5827596.1 DUF302 domain-containing protein [Cyanobacteria bacterium M_surface_7_m2_040]